jgi:hypothetical protein
VLSPWFGAGVEFRDPFLVLFPRSLFRLYPFLVDADGAGEETEGTCW